MRARSARSRFPRPARRAAGLAAAAPLAALLAALAAAPALAQTGYDGPGIIRPTGPPQVGQGYDAIGRGRDFSLEQQRIRQESYRLPTPQVQSEPTRRAAKPGDAPAPLSVPPASPAPSGAEISPAGAATTGGRGGTVDFSTNGLFIPRKTAVPLD